MKKIIAKITLAAALMVPSIASAGQAKGLNVILTSGDSQTQAMATVLSLMTIKKHKKEVNIVLCGKAGDLADKNIKGVPTKKPDGKVFTAQKQLQMLIILGATVQVCPLYLPNAGKDKSVLLDGITVAKPPVVAGKLLSKDYKNLSY